ncbi:DUF1330 domain-containing protein [Phyllobacterium sp. 628]|uniref:DUF1330 domain-containing protein n=1 Tax=Phyllobacterium sp. 628 TaxID=2718938 RepID=UPI0016624DBD|nr:DUF1330 domain-containing protein [Phyllobacterium sp. 628]QND53775.1 DUF1330 domain-containing protein [Phyllobacterium sp. 628]
MSAYAIGHLRAVTMGPGIVAYLKGIDATLAPFGGRFIIHGGSPEVKEGQWAGDLIIIEFPGLEQVRDWYQSPAYQDILSFRSDNSEGAIFLIDGTSADHRATDVLG